MSKPRILTLVDHYLPGYKAGGPLRTVENMVEQLGDELGIRIVTRNHDLGDNIPYDGVSPGVWYPVGKAEALYLAPSELTFGSLRRVIAVEKPDALYLNSFFSSAFTIKPLLLRRLGMIPNAPVVVAPRGEFSPGAISIKFRKKRAYVRLARALGLYRGVIWQASSVHEEADIRRWFGGKAEVIVAPDLPARAARPEDSRPREKTEGRLKVVFLSRISRKKNLDGALRMLTGLDGEIEFNIWGPIEDAAYWTECREIMDVMPSNVRVRHLGAVSHDQVHAVMSDNDIFLFPTLGENFGHVILEALVAGCPVLISDQTPWRDLEEKGVGWDIPLDQPERFQAALGRLAAMGNEEYREWSRRAREYRNRASQG